MSDSPERRAWLDKLLSFMDENKTPITACPTISKNPLDLYALYLHVRERGGFVEVSISYVFYIFCNLLIYPIHLWVDSISLFLECLHVQTFKDIWAYVWLGHFVHIQKLFAN